MSPKTKEQNEIIRADKKALILEAALHLFAEESYHGTSVSKIAKHAGVSKGLMYNYFESKEELLTTLVMELADKMLERFPTSSSPDDALIENYIDQSFDIILEDIVHAKLFFATYIQPEVMALVSERMMEKSAPFMEVLMTYFKNKKVEDPEAMMWLFTSALDGVQMHLIMNPEYPIERVKRLLKKQFTHI